LFWFFFHRPWVMIGSPTDGLARMLQSAGNDRVTEGDAMTTVREIMHRGAECIGEHDSLLEAAQKMRNLDVGALPICGDDNRLKGIVTDRDIVIKCIASGRNPAKCEASELATGTPQWIEADDDVEAALDRMERNRIKRLPVVDNGNHKLIGMVSEADLAQHLPPAKIAQFAKRVFTPH
jgi:CBS domain-containing protein